MTAILGLGLVGVVIGGAWWMRSLHRSVASLSSRVSSIPSRVDGELRQFRGDLERLQAGHENAVEVRVRRAEAAAAQVAREHGLLARHVAWMEPWVRHWAAGDDDSRDERRPL